MDNKQKYDKVFIESLSVSERDWEDDLLYNSVPEWDSIGHMTLVAELEEVFDITMEMDDIIEFSSYKKGLEILKKYEIDFF